MTLTQVKLGAVSVLPHCWFDV